MAESPRTRPRTAYKRTYKACEWCRRNKAKCEVEPSSTSCSKCNRERRQCVFPPQRSTKKTHASSPEKHRIARNENGRRRKAMRADTDDTTNELVRPTSDSNQNNTSLPAHLQSDVVQKVVTSSNDAIGLLFGAANAEESDVSEGTNARDGVNTALDPSIMTPGLSTTSSIQHESPELIALWRKHRFVLQGWFTALEAIQFVEFFFQHLAALSPAADSFYTDEDIHENLVLREPLLCCAILMISSRHLSVSGRGGATRSGFIHARLWRHIESLIQRITFGSEKYSTAKTRTLGSIQALLLIIEWHPRYLHFPPENDGWDASLTATVDDNYQPQARSSDANHRWREDVFEPAKRSDRLSWMLVGLATTLAHELAVFDTSDDDQKTFNQSSSSTSNSKARIRQLLFLYTSQLSLRLGCSNVFPSGIRLALNSHLSSSPAADRDWMLSKWIGITKLMTTATQMFFANQTTTKMILESHQYIGLLEHLQPLLDSWHKEFMEGSCPSISESARQILLVDYYHVKMYTSSVAIQALVERAGRSNFGNIWLDQENLRKEYAQDFKYINDVRQSSGNILVIAEKLSGEGMLQYCPVRFFLRIVSASIFLLKAMSLGLRETEAATSIGQLERCIAALRSNSADDIHLSGRYAELIARHVRRFKRNFRVHRTVATTAGEDIIGLTVAIGGGDATSNNVLERAIESSTGLEASYDGFNDHQQQQFGTDDFMDEWLTQPFNPEVAPFGLDYTQLASGLSIDSLDFLWNMQGI